MNHTRSALVWQWEGGCQISVAILYEVIMIAESTYSI